MRAHDDRHGVLGLPPLLALARERGLDAEELLAEAGIPASVLSDPLATVPVERVHALVQLLLDRTGDPGLGLDAGRQYHLATFGLLGAVAAVTPTARQMLRLFVDFAHLTFTFFVLAFEEDGERARLVFVPDGDLGPLHRFYLDREVAFAAWMAREFWPLSHRQLFAAVELDYAAPADVERYRATVAPCPVRFGAAEAAITFDFTTDQPRPDANPLGVALLTEHLRSFAQARERDHIIDRVRREIALSVARHHALPGLDVVAPALGLSERALRRRLVAVGTSFRALTDDVLAPLAKRFLRDSALSVGSLAERLGYSESASFVRAFRRWTGTTPEAFRNARRAEAGEG